MMFPNPLLFMPFLHKEFRPAAFPFSLLQLWPGLPNPHQGFFVPDDYPLTPQDAAQYMEYVRSISIAALDTVPVHSLLAAEQQMQHPDTRKEAQDIAAFVQGEKAATTAAWHTQEARLAAQKALLRVWFLEERHLEIQELKQRCRTLADDFTAALGVELEDEEAGALLLTQNTQHLDTTAVPAAPWRFLLENAALFLPERSTLLFTNSEICLELRDVIETTSKVQAELYLPNAPPPARTPALAEAPLWKAFGMKDTRPERPWLAKMFSFLLWDDA